LASDGEDHFVNSTFDRVNRFARTGHRPNFGFDGLGDLVDLSGELLGFSELGLSLGLKSATSVSSGLLDL